MVNVNTVYMPPIATALCPSSSARSGKPKLIKTNAVEPRKTAVLNAELAAIHLVADKQVILIAHQTSRTRSILSHLQTKECKRNDNGDDTNNSGKCREILKFHN